MNTKEYDLIVIGGGSGGVRAARVAGSLGKSVALIESQKLGGTCVNLGCVPKKIFSYSAHYKHSIDYSNNLGWTFDNAQFNWQILKANKDKEIARLNNAYDNTLENNNVTVYEGYAEFVDNNTVTLTPSSSPKERGEQLLLKAKKILITTGSRPFIPDVKGSEYIETSDNFFHWDELPQSITIVGSGYIAVEIASILAQWGVQVNLIVRSKVLRTFDRELADKLTADLQANNINILLQTEIKEINKTNNLLEITLSTGEIINSEKILYATGRVPNTEKLSLQNTDVQLGKKGEILVNEYFQTTSKNIYALGDVIDRVQLTPVAIQEAMAFIDTQYNNKPRVINYSLIPTVVFSIPQVATIGLTEEQALEQYSPDNIKVLKSSFRSLKHVVDGSDHKSLIKVIINKADNKVLGIHLLGEEVGEILQGFAVGMSMGMTLEDLHRTIAIHPTLAEEIVTIK